MWTEKNRSRYNRDHLRYPSDVTDEEWELIAPLIPSAKRGGGKRRVDMRAAVNGVMYVRRDVCVEHGLPVALSSQGLAAVQHGEPLFLRLEL